MQITYCVQWSRHYSRLHEPLPEAQARKRHADNKLYTAVLGDPKKPRCFLEFSAYRSVCVEFLDDALRSYLVLSFAEEQPNRLFLESVVVRHFHHLQGEVSDAQLYYFKTDGRLFIEHYEVGPTGPSVLIESQESRADMSSNWTPFPEFGNYDSLANFDRAIPALIDAAQPGS